MLSIRLARAVFLSLFFQMILLDNIFIQASVIHPSFELNVDLKKDEILKATIISSRENSSEKIFTLRWTLYRNQGLVILVRYDGYPYQFMLYKDYRLNSWNLNLLDTQGVNRSLDQPYLKVYFLSIDDPFNDEKTIAHLKIQVFGDVNFMKNN